MTKIAKEVGVDVAMVPKPYEGTIPTGKGMIAHYSRV
jgi:dihydrodipicolinate synthase/N-acetylneuraminate lyase